MFLKYGQLKLELDKYRKKIAIYIDKIYTLNIPIKYLCRYKL